jgi:hypothetical protein
MLVRGEWQAGAAEAMHACQRLAEPVNLLTLGRAHYLDGNYHRLRGSFDDAEAAFEQANERGYEPPARPGVATTRTG